MTPTTFLIVACLGPSMIWIILKPALIDVMQFLFLLVNIAMPGIFPFCHDMFARMPVTLSRMILVTIRARESMPSVLEPAPNVRAREKAGIVTTELQFGIRLCLRKMRVKEPGPADQGTLGDNFLLPKPAGVAPVRHSFKRAWRVWLHYKPHVWPHKLNYDHPRHFCICYLSKRVCDPSLRELLEVRLGLSVRARTFNFDAVLWDRRNNQSIATCTYYPFLGLLLNVEGGYYKIHRHKKTVAEHGPLWGRLTSWRDVTAWRPDVTWRPGGL